MLPSTWCRRPGDDDREAPADSLDEDQIASAVAQLEEVKELES
ncbi:MAG TPA: hypothetical protein VGL78_03455 [Solirubrobacteraceae bacterium]|jgi:hypothetical protein